MFELSQRLIGIYKTSNQTRSKLLPAKIVGLWLIKLDVGISIDNRNLHAFLPSPSQPNGGPSAGGSYMNGSVAA